jgi:hypothetical protein
MKQQEIKTILASLFVPRKPNENGEGDGVAFRSEYMDKSNLAYPVYEAVSTCGFESNLTHSFSYEIMSRACSILCDLEDWDATDELQEQIDAMVPVYTSELMQVYAANSWAVDEAREEYGTGENSDSDAGRAWYMLIERMTNSIMEALTELSEEI